MNSYLSNQQSFLECKTNFYGDHRETDSNLRKFKFYLSSTEMVNMLSSDETAEDFVPSKNGRAEANELGHPIDIEPSLEIENADDTPVGIENDDGTEEDHVHVQSNNVRAKTKEIGIEPPVELEDEPPKLTVMEVRNKHPDLTPEEIQDASYNFGVTAVGNEMTTLLRQGRYDNFMEVNFSRDKKFIEYRKTCPVSYHLIGDFKRVWKYNEFLSNEPENFEHNQNVALKKITEEFFRKDVFNWINNKTRGGHKYSDLYVDILQAYRRGIRNVKNFSLKEFSSSKNR